jgi:hypothetical protein
LGYFAFRKPKTGVRSKLPSIAPPPARANSGNKKKQPLSRANSGNKGNQPPPRVAPLPRVNSGNKGNQPPPRVAPLPRVNSGNKGNQPPPRVAPLPRVSSVNKGNQPLPRVNKGKQPALPINVPSSSGSQGSFSRALTPDLVEEIEDTARSDPTRALQAGQQIVKRVQDQIGLPPEQFMQLAQYMVQNHYDLYLQIFKDKTLIIDPAALQGINDSFLKAMVSLEQQSVALTKTQSNKNVALAKTAAQRNVMIAREQGNGVRTWFARLDKRNTRFLIVAIVMVVMLAFGLVLYYLHPALDEASRAGKHVVGTIGNTAETARKVTGRGLDVIHHSSQVVQSNAHGVLNLLDWQTWRDWFKHSKTDKTWNQLKVNAKDPDVLGNFYAPI